MDGSFKDTQCFLRHQIGFVEDDHIGKLDLIGQQVNNGPVIQIIICQIPVGQCFSTAKIVEKVISVHYGHHRINVSKG